MPSSKSGKPPHDRYLSWVIAGGLLALVTIVYGQTLWFGFTDYDDNLFVTDSPPVLAGLTGKSIVWALTNGPSGEWYPLAMMSHMLDCQLFGTRAWGHHLTNLVLHAASTIGLFLVLRSMTGEIWPSALVATIFAIHPQRVESVVWIAERRDVLSGLFFVLTLAAYDGYLRHGRTVARYLLVALMLALGLMAKPMLVTVPPLLVVLDYWPLGRFGRAADLPKEASSRSKQSFRWLIVEKLPLLALAMAVLLISLRTHGTRPKPYILVDRLANAVVTLVEYLGQFFYPVKLAVFYPIPAAGYPAWQVAGCLAVLIAITIAAFMTCRRMPYFVVGWCWFVGLITPVLGLVPVADHAMADRYMYLPGIGLAIALAWSAERIAGRSPAARWALAGWSALAVVALVALAFEQTAYWHDDLALWQHAAAVTEDNVEVQIGLGDALRNAHRFDEALDHYRQAARFDPDDPFVANNMGGTLYELGRWDESAAAYGQALRINPKHLSAVISLSTVLTKLGRPVEAERYLRWAIELDPTLSIPHVYLAQLYLTAGRPDLALAEREQAVVVEPKSAALRNALGQLRESMGDAPGAIADFQEVLKLDSKFVAAHVSLGRLLAARGDTEAAIAHFRQALKIQPDQPAVRDSLDALRSGARSPRP